MAKSFKSLTPTFCDAGVNGLPYFSTFSVSSKIMTHVNKTAYDYYFNEHRTKLCAVIIVFIKAFVLTIVCLLMSC